MKDETFFDMQYSLCKGVTHTPKSQNINSNIEINDTMKWGNLFDVLQEGVEVGQINMFFHTNRQLKLRRNAKTNKALLLAIAN